jgi:hypothetical protein
MRPVVKEKKNDRMKRFLAHAQSVCGKTVNGQHRISVDGNLT